MKKLLVAWWPIIFVVVTWFIFSHPYFLKGLVPYPSTYQVNFFAPWSANQEFWGPVKNNAMPDVIDQIYPWKFFTVQAYNNGQIPTWNPYNFSGNPHVANYQSAVFSPFNLLFFLLPFLDAWSILVLMQPLLAGVGMYLFMRELSVGKISAFMSSVAFMFCGFIVVWMAYGTLAMAIAFLPFVLYGIEKNMKEPKIIWGCIIALGLILSFFSGHFQTSFYLAATTFFYMLFRFTQVHKKKNIAHTFFFYILGIAISLIQIAPSVQFYLSSARSDIFLTGGGIPWHYLVTIFAPDFYGNPVTRNDWFGYYAEWAGFVGIIPLFFALLSFFAERKKTTVFFFGLVLFSLAFALESPLYQLFVFLKIPVLATSTPSRIIILTSFALSVMAGIGFETFQNFIHKQERKRTVAAILALGSLLLLIWSLLFFTPALPADKALIAKRNLLLPTILFGITASLSFYLVLVKNNRLAKMFLLLFLLLTTIDSSRYAAKWMPFDPREHVFPNVPVITAISERIGNTRIYGNLGTQAESYFGFASVEGYDPLYIERYGEFIRAAESGEYLPPERSVVTLSRQGKHTDRVLDFLGVSLIFHPIADTNQSWAYPVWEKNEKYKVVYYDSLFQLFENQTALPRASLFYTYEVKEDPRDVLKRFYTEEFPFRETLLLEEDPNVAIGDTSQIGSATIEAYSPNYIRIKTRTQTPALLLLTDNYYPTWRVSVNGVAEKIFRANYSFRAVVVPEGESIVEFRNSLI